MSVFASSYVCCLGNRIEFVGIPWTKPTSRRATCMLSTCMHTSCIEGEGNVSCWNRVVIVAVVALDGFLMFQQHPTAFTGGVAAWQGTWDEMPAFPTRQPRVHGKVEFPHFSVSFFRSFLFFGRSCFLDRALLYSICLFSRMFSCFLFHMF